MRHELHPACALWPPMAEPELAGLAKDVGARGLIHPITLCEGKILDGRNRELACERAGVEPQYTVYDGDDPIGFSISANLHRRHLDKIELSFIAEGLASLKHGGDRRSEKFKPFERDLKAVAAQMGIGASNVGSVRVLRMHAEPNVVAMARHGDVGIQAAAAYARNTPRLDQRKATAAIVRDRGNVLKKGHRRLGAKREKLPTELMIMIHPDDLKELRLLIKGVKEQSRKNAATVSFTHLATLATKLEHLLMRWLGDEPEIERTSDPSAEARVQGG